MNSRVAARQLAVEMNRQTSNDVSKSSFEGSPYAFSGQFLVNGAGELLKSVNFPVSFIERPFVFIGGCLDDNYSPTDGEFPYVVGCVARYDTVVSGNQVEQKLWRGATLSVVTSGSSDSKFWVNYMFTGVALSNPVSGSGTSDSAI